MGFTDPAETPSEITDAEKRKRLLEYFNTIRDESVFKDVPHISSEELLHILEDPNEEVRKSVVIVDCRSESEQAVSILPGALPMIDVEKNLDKYKDSELIPYCAIGRRSGLFAKRVLDRDPTIKIRNHVGGILDWSHVDGPLVDKTTQQPTKRVHAGGPYHLRHLPSSKDDMEFLLPGTSGMTTVQPL